jgi:inorganic pyrophosphatase
MSDENPQHDSSTETQPRELQRVGQLIHHVRTYTGAVLNDYDVAVDGYEQTEVTLTVTLTQDAPRGVSDEFTDAQQLLRETIEHNEQTYGDGVPKQFVLDASIYDADVTHDELATALDTLRARGEVYEPTADHLRVV